MLNYFFSVHLAKSTRNIAIGIAIFSGLFLVPTLAGATGTHTPPCGLTAKAGRTIVVFPKDDKIRSDKSFDESRGDMMPFALSAGSYKVTLVSYDQYPDRKAVTQPHESWFVRIFDEQERTIADTHATKDLEDGVDEAKETEVVNEKLVLSQDSKKVQAAHAVYPDTSNPNSVIPVCAAFDKIETPKIVASCSASDNTIEVGESVTWKAEASGGTGSYTNAWSGTNGLSGSNKSVTKTYTSEGQKNATVVVTSGDQSVTKTCSVDVEEEEVPALNGSCTVSPSSIRANERATWRATASGGEGDYTYSWTGSDNLSGSNRTVIKDYSDSGTKTGRVTIASGNQSITRTCSLEVEHEEVINNLSGSCYADPSTAFKGDTIIWRTNASGGNGTRSYSWTGSDNLSSNSQNVSRSYDSAGSKSATVVVTSGNQSIARSCSINVQERETPAAILSACSVAPANPTVNQRVVWTATASGGNGGHTFNWTGTDGLTGTGAMLERMYATTGTKTATVLVTGANGQQVSKTCSVEVAAGVNLGNDIPYTGFGDMLPIALFTTGILGASAAAGMYFVRRRGDEGVWDDTKMNL